MNHYLCFDIGGTKIKYGILSEDYKIIMHDQMDTEAKKGGPSIVDKVIEKTHEVKKTITLSGIAISTAGVIDPYEGVVVNATDAIPNYIGVRIKDTIEQRTGLTVEVQNDVNCFALCEKVMGNGFNCRHFITLTIGTGIGGAIHVNDQMYYGNGFSAGEWGRMYINDQTFESLASMTGLIRLANQSIEPRDDWNGEKIFSLYDQGDVRAIHVVQWYYRYLAQGVTNLIYIFNPERVIIGGGITNRTTFISELNEAVKEIIDQTFYNQTEIVSAKYKNHSGMIGALYHYHFMQRQRHNI